MPPQLQNLPNLPIDFNLGTGQVPSPPSAPMNALPQRQNRTATTTNNGTQPFNINNQQQQPNNNQNQQQQTTTSSSFRRRERRQRQQQYHQFNNIRNNNNRFTAFEDENVNDYNHDDDVQENIILYNNKQKKKKQRLYLDPNRIMRYMEDNSFSTVSGRGNQSYILATTSIYEDWVRNNYELQVWQSHLKMGIEHKHWAKEIIQRTKKRDDVTNTKFVQKKINRLTMVIAQSSATIAEMQIQLGIYWAQTTEGATTPSTAAAATATSTTTTNRSRDPVERVEKSILKYIQNCTQHVKKMAENRIQLAKTQMEEYKALEDFQQVATPLQWDIHLILKPKLKIWSTKNKNQKIVLKRTEYDLPPKFISNIELSFKIDESIISKEESQIIYDKMRQLTKEYRTQAMTLYVQSTIREHELLSNEINQIIKGFPKENDDGFDAEPGVAAFKHYNDLREKRFNLEAEQSVYFLEEQRVEGGINNIEEEVTAPTLTRSLGKDFLLQQ